MTPGTSRDLGPDSTGIFCNAVFTQQENYRKYSTEFSLLVLIASVTRYFENSLSPPWKTQMAVAILHSINFLEI